ncbi:MAG: DUF2975 domain-containing protein [Bacteroidales bacterium]|nr:DUF2975 domain-containing protein [Candidatus Sodaliphilus aphodohippi]
MEKKFNFICVIMLVALLLGILTPVIGTIGSFTAGFSDGWNSDSVKVEKISGTVTAVSLMPLKQPLSFTHEIVNEKTGDTEGVQIVQAMVNSKKVDRSNRLAFNIGMPALGLVSSVIAITFIVFFVKIILAVNRNQIFDKLMERRLAWCGWLLIGYYAVNWTVVLANYFHCKAMFSFAGYAISIVNYPAAAILLAGIGMLLIGQIFGIARHLKEEQELTI